MGKTILRPTLNDSSSNSVSFSETINVIPTQKSPDDHQLLDFGFDSEDYDYLADIDLHDAIKQNHVYEEKKIDLKINEAIAWDPRDAFIQSVCAKLFYVIPAFIVGLMVGVFLWALYIFLYKARIRYFKTTTSESSSSSAESSSNTEMGVRDQNYGSNSNDVGEAVTEVNPSKSQDSNPISIQNLKMTSTIPQTELTPNKKVKSRKKTRKSSSNHPVDEKSATQQ